MAEGGIVTRPTFAMIGEAGPEAVLPLRDLPSAGGGSVLVTGNTVLGGSLDEFAEIVARSINRRGQFA